jgi:plasmid rolling circle replication initiator protein Rep
LSVLAPVLTLPILGSEDNRSALSDVSPRDKPWDVHKVQADTVARLYELSHEFLGLRYAERIRECARWLEFALSPDLTTGEVRHRLHTARFCRTRYCPICQWRRSLMWCARFMTRVASMDFGRMRWLHLTLTVQNVPVDQLRWTLVAMNAAWHRLIQRQVWPAVGFIRTTEITKAKDGRAHPHFHALLLVPSSYFGRKYIRQAAWVRLWREALRADYDPSVRIQAFEPKTVTDPETGETRKLAPVEGLKYAVKPADLVGDGSPRDAEWLAELTRQTHKLRFMATGGILKDALREEAENDELIHADGETNGIEEIRRLWYRWDSRRYRRA